MRITYRASSERNLSVVYSLMLDINADLEKCIFLNVYFISVFTYNPYSSTAYHMVIGWKLVLLAGLFIHSIIPDLYLRSTLQKYSYP